jgi:hypothetical protein
MGTEIMKVHSTWSGHLQEVRPKGVKGGEVERKKKKKKKEKTGA